MEHRKQANAELYQRDYGSLLLLAGNSKKQMKTRQADLKIITINPGQSTSHHFHLERESIFYLLEGRLEFRSQFISSNILMNQRDTLILRPGEDHVFTNPEAYPAVVLEIESPPHSGEDKIMISESYANCDRPAGRFWRDPVTTKLKICGVKSLDIAYFCAAIGVDAIGFHAVGADWQKVLPYLEWVEAVPEQLSAFLLTDITEPALVCTLLNRLRCDTLQLQGDMAAEDIIKLSRIVKENGYHVVKSIAVPMPEALESTLEKIYRITPYLDAILLDSCWQGGTGKNPDWTVTGKIAVAVTVPVILAGGISAANIADLRNTIQPFGMDVESSVEHQFQVNGKRRTVKDPAKIQYLVSQLESSGRRI